jgi:serine-type D-Ala-D-Ala carboxypeptidase/endopeptidase (penicillin-binding protein 4)
VLRKGKGIGRIGALLLVAVMGVVGVARADTPLTRLPTPVQAVLAKHKLPEDSLSVYVQDVTASAPLLTVNAQIPRNPASVMKLVTTLVAMHELGPSFRFHTDVYADRQPVKGRLEGNLYLRGQGDPFLVTESFWRLLKDLRQSGLVHVTGDLVLDGSYFAVPDVYRGDFDGRPYRAYNVQPHASLVNFFATTFKFFPEPHEARVRIEADPPMSTLAVDNRIVVTKEKCSWHNRKVDMQVLSMGPQPSVVFSGKYPGSCGSYELLRAVADPVPYVFGAFKPMWEEMGGRIGGTGRAGLLPDDAVRVHRAVSRPLAELITFMNKFSNNVMTRNLLLALGARTYGAPGTEEKGRRAVADWLLLHDIKAPELRVDNGSGLSRNAQASALTLARLLLASWNSNFMPEFVSSLPLSAMDGTMRKRFRASDLEGQAHMKTGLLNGVRAIGGFMRTRSGRNLVMVSLHNHPGVQYGSGTEVQDALIEWLYEQ